MDNEGCMDINDSAAEDWDEFCSRTVRMVGCDAVETLRNSHVAVFGIGGVGSFTAEALARAGIGELTLVDADVVAVSNINRQLVALTSTVGKAKVEVMRDRILDINPQARVHCKRLFFGSESSAIFDFAAFDYVVDAVDSVSAKLELITVCKAATVPVISCMGAGNKLDPTRFEVADIARTSVCPLAKVVRRELQKRGVEDVKVVYSKEPPLPVCAEAAEADGGGRKVAPGSISFVPSVAGLILAGEVIKNIGGLMRAP